MMFLSFTGHKRAGGGRRPPLYDYYIAAKRKHNMLVNTLANNSAVMKVA